MGARSRRRRARREAKAAKAAQEAQQLAELERLVDDFSKSVARHSREIREIAADIVADRARQDFLRRFGD